MSILSVIIHILFIFMVECLIFYLYLVPLITKVIYDNIYLNINNQNSTLRIFFYYIFSVLYKQNKLYKISSTENENIDYNNKITIVICTLLLLSLSAIFIIFILVIKYKLNMKINWKFIFYTSGLSILLISLYEFIFIYTLYMTIKNNEYTYMLEILNILYKKYNILNMNTTEELKKALIPIDLSSTFKK